MTLQIVLSLIAIAIFVALVFEVNGWRKGTRLVTKKQKVYRIIAGLILETILWMVIFGHSVNAGKHPLFQISYYAIVLMLSFFLFAIALLDVREGLIIYRESRKEIFQQLIDQERKK